MRTLVTRGQGRHAECEEIVTSSLRWREELLGPDAAGTLGAVYDLAHHRRYRHFSAAIDADANGVANGVLNGVAHSEADCDAGGEADGRGEAGGEAGASALDGDKISRVRTALDSASTAASDLDSRWLAGLHRLCEGEADPTGRAAEHLAMLASSAQLHADHMEAVYLMRLALPG